MMEIKSFTFNDYQENTFLIIKNGKKTILSKELKYNKKSSNVLLSFVLFP